VALACYRQQTYPHRELVIVDDGDVHPVSREAAEAAGGRLIRVPAGTPIGVKLNVGVRESSGVLCHKMDDDDWYAPDFLERMVTAWLASRRKVCIPALALGMPFLFFDVGKWEIRRSRRGLNTGATFLFSRDDWTERPFREVRRDDDEWFVLDRNQLGRVIIPVPTLESFLSVRHAGASGERGHTWLFDADARPAESPFAPGLYEKRPEHLLPEWALAIYREIRDRIRTPIEDHGRGFVET
jgi:glycosyltransferase involved in cell wall biosynthesis